MKNNRGFKRALITSAVFHILILLLLLASPSLPRPAKKGTIYYLPLNLVGPPGGGGGGGGGGSPAAKATTSKQPSLRELTAIQKKTPEAPSSSLRYPVDKKTLSKKIPEKKTVITKPQPESAETGTETGGTGSGQAGSGIRIGVGPGPGGPGTGGWGGGNFDLSAFPFTYYLQIIQDRISANWFTSLIDPGTSGEFQCMVFFKILRDGRITDLQIEASSNSRTFDLSALRAVQNASPFPPLPREFEGEYLGVHLIFEHIK
jgi:protein TonB